MAVIVKEMTSEGFHVKPEVREGRPSAVIMDMAKKEKVSIVVLGSHGKSDIAELLMGSVSENVIRYAKVPVLVISKDNA